MQEVLRQLLKEQKFDEFEDQWIRAIEENRCSLDELLAIARELKSIKESSRAFLLLEILAEHLVAENRLSEAIEVYKNMAYFTNDDTEIRRRIVAMYKKIYQTSPRLETFLEQSGIEKGEHLFKSLEKLTSFLTFDVGNIFYFDRLGIGEVVGIKPERNEIILDFEKQKGYLLKIDVARELLKPLGPGHFLYKKYRCPLELKEMAKDDPVKIVKFMLRSFNEALSAQQIKNHLKRIFDDSEIDKFWEKIRRQLESDEEIEVIEGTKKLYQYIPEGEDKTLRLIKKFESADLNEKYEIAERCLKKHKNIFEKFLPELLEEAKNSCATNPWLSLDILFLCKSYNKDIQPNYGIDDILKYACVDKIIAHLKNDEHKKILLRMLKEREGSNYQETFKKLFFTADDFTVFDEIEEYLKDLPDELTSIYQTVFSIPKNFPSQYQWLLKKLVRGELAHFINPTTLPRLIGSLDYVKGIRPLFFKIINLERFDELLKNATETDAQRIQNAIIDNSALEDYEKKDFLRIIEFHFPNLSEKETNLIYATEESLKKRKEELHHLLTVEIQQNKKEISRAREYGDLSENFEYKAAKERQDQLYQKVRDIENELKMVKIIDLSNVDTSKISVGTKVTLRNEKDRNEIAYSILGRWDTDLSKNIISNESPIAQKLLGRNYGEKVEINGIVYEIVKISPFRKEE